MQGVKVEVPAVRRSSRGAVTSHLETQLQKWSGAVQDSVVTFIPGAASYTARLGTGWHDAERASSKT